MKVEELPLPGAKLISPQVFRDPRGFFLETFQSTRYKGAGIEEEFVQDNLSFSKYGTIRGMHFQSQPGQSKLVKVVKGKIFDVIVDMRKTSKTYKKWLGITLDDKFHQQLYIPVGFAHGFCCLSDEAYLSYKVSSEYNPKTECTFHYNDPEISIEWPLCSPMLSERDKTAPFFKEVIEEFSCIG